jgi:uncharacterized protein (DUF736 family)
MLVTDKHGDAAGEAKGRPVLVYFFWPTDRDEKGNFLDKRGEATKKIDDKVFGSATGDDMEKVARTSSNFHTIKVNAKTADAQLMKNYKVDPAQAPCFRITSADGKVVASISGLKMGANDLKKELEKALKTQFPEYYKELDAKLKEIAKVFEEGKAAMKKNDLATALAKFQAVCDAVPKSDLIDQAATNMDTIKAKQKKEAKEDTKK